MSLCVISESPRYPGTPLFQVNDPAGFYQRYSEWVSRFLIINELFMLRPFMDLLEQDGWQVVVAESAQKILEDYERWSQPLEIDNFQITRSDGTPSDLFPYQRFTLNRALERSRAKGRYERMFFFGFAAGAGKSAISAAGAQELFNRGQVDLVLAFTLKTLRRSLYDFFTGTTELHTCLLDGTPAKRRKLYDEGFQAIILNYDKAHWDQEHLYKLVEGKRVLYVLDEAHKLLTDAGKTLARKGMDKLVKASDTPIVWPMTASAVQETPLNYRDVFNLDGMNSNPLGSKAQFEEDYLESKRTVHIPTKWGGSFPVTYYKWDNAKLQNIRHRVADRTQSVRKTDPGVKENFMGLQTEVIHLELSSEDRRLYEVVKSRAAEAKAKELSVEPYYRIMRYICNTPESLQYSSSELAQEYVECYSSLITSKNSAKMETMIEQVKGIRGAGDKVVIFTQWTKMSLFLIAAELRKHKINFVEHYGQGMTDAERDLAVSEFKTNKNITVFLSSDAGAHGLSFQMARYVINYDTPFSYDTLNQRQNRIDRADSYLDGLTSYVYVTADTIEERIWQKNNQRRELASATLGTQEVLSYTSESDPETIDWLIFGK